MNLLNKKIFLFGLIIVFLTITIGVILVFDWQNTDIPTDIPIDTSSDISEEVVKAKCLEDVSRMTEEELINEIDNLKYSEEIDLITGEDRITSVHKKIIDYFIYKVRKTKNEDDYNLAKKFISELNIQEKNKQDSLNKLDEAYSEEQGFNYLLRRGDLADICPDKLPQSCLNFMESNNLSIPELWCTDICNELEKYANDQNLFNKKVVNFKEWSDDEKLVNSQYQWRVSVAFRFGNKESALKVCNNLPSIELKNNCFEIINIFDCSYFREEINRLICDRDN